MGLPSSLCSRLEAEGRRLAGRKWKRDQQMQSSFLESRCVTISQKLPVKGILGTSVSLLASDPKIPQTSCKRKARSRVIGGSFDIDLLKNQTASVTALVEYHVFQAR